MPDETTQETTEQTTEQTTETKPVETTTETKPAEETKPTILSAVTPPPLVGADGKFHEDWRKSLPEELREEKCLDNVTDFHNAIKQLVSHKKMIGKDRVVVPTEKSGPEEWDAFYAAIGRPKTADDYKAEIPEDLKSFFPDERLAENRKWAYENGVPEKLYTSFMAREVEYLNWLNAEQKKLEEQAVRDAEDGLRKEFGAAYEQRIHVADRLIADAFPNEEERMQFLQQFGDNPAFVRFAAKVGSRLNEHVTLVADLTKNAPGEAKAEIEKLRATPGYLDMDNTKMTPEQRTAITNQINDLYREIYPANKAG